MQVATIGHGTRAIEELVACLHEAGVETLVDVRRFPGSKRNPQFDQSSLRESLADAGIAYRHESELGGRRSGEPGEDDFTCVRVGAFRSYAARMRSEEWQSALTAALATPSPCLMCAETPPWRCHRQLIAELLLARGHDVVHLMAPGKRVEHRSFAGAEARSGRLYLCGRLVA